MKPKATRLERLRKIMTEIEDAGDPAEITAVSDYLQSFATRTRVRAMPLYMQRNGVIAASLTNDRAGLRAFLESQHEEIRTAAEEALRPGAGRRVQQFL